MCVWAQDEIKLSLQFLKTIKWTIFHVWKLNLPKRLVSCSLGTQENYFVGSIKIVIHVFSPVSVTEYSDIIWKEEKKPESDDLGSNPSSVANYLCNLGVN